jgi:recombination protein RecA
MAAALDLLRLRLEPRSFSLLSLEGPVRPSAWPELDAVLPDHGFPRGIIELASPHALGGATSMALAVIRAAQQREERAWCAWVDSEATLYAPAVAKAGVDLNRLLVVRPPPDVAGRVALKVAQARACEVIVVDLSPRTLIAGRTGRRQWVKPEVLVRRLALAAEESGASILLLTDSLVPHATPLPVALRLELARAPGHTLVKVAKDRRGRTGLAKGVVPMRTRPSLPLDEIG